MTIWDAHNRQIGPDYPNVVVSQIYERELLKFRGRAVVAMRWVVQDQSAVREFTAQDSLYLTVWEAFMVRVKVIEEVRTTDPSGEQGMGRRGYEADQVVASDRVKTASASRHAVKTLAARGVLEWNGAKPAGIKGVQVQRHTVSETIIEGRR